MKTYETIAKENEAVVRKMYAAFKTGNTGEVLKYLSGDVFLTIPSKGLNAGEYWGHAGFKKFFSNIMSYYGGKFVNEIVAFAAGDKHVFVREFNVLNRKDDDAQEWQLPMVMQYDMRNGKIVQMRVIPEYADVYDAYWMPGAENPRKGEQLFAKDRHALGNAVSVEQYDFMQAKYAGFWNGDYNVFEPVTGSGFEFYLTGNSVLAGTYKGYKGYLEFRNKLVQITGDKYQLMIEAFAASDTDVFVVEKIYQNTIHQQKPGYMYVLMHFIINDGMIARANDFPLDAAAYEKFYGTVAAKKESLQIA